MKHICSHVWMLLHKLKLGFRTELFLLVNLWFLPSYSTGELSVSYSHIASVHEMSMSINR